MEKGKRRWICSIFKRIAPVSLVSILLLCPGCGDKKTASDPGNVAAVKLEQIIKRPADYSGKEVAVEGNFFPSCCEDDFVLKDGIGQIQVLKAGALRKFKAKTAQPVRVSGIVRSTAESPYIQATALEVR